MYINGLNNATTILSSFDYWLGSGSIIKNYSFQNLTSVVNSYQYCIYPYHNNITFNADMDMDFSAIGYTDNSYTLRNASLTNISSNILLYLIPDDEGTKFFLTVKKGITFLSNTVVTIQKYFVGEGVYKTVGIKITDGEGEFTTYLDLDESYRYSVVKDGVLLGIVDRSAICASAPCEQTIFLSDDTTSTFAEFYGVYANQTLSTLTFNKTTNIITYQFLDLTGLANYFRLQVNQVYINNSNNIICDVTSFSSAGTLTCNVTGYTGDIIARGYISRSPEKLDKVLSILLNADIIEALGLDIFFISIGAIITLVFASAVASRGSPSSIIMTLFFTILGLKLMFLFPFSLIVTVIIELLIFFIWTKLKV